MFSLLTLILLGPVFDSGDVKTVNVNGNKREYILYDPVGSSTTPKRAILAFHGFGQTADDLEKDIGLNALAKKEKFVVIYPRGLEGGWNAGACCSAADDLAFIDALISTVQASSNIDNNHLFAVGMSNGGMMAYRLAAERPTQFAAVAVVGGSMETAPSTSKPVAVLHIHGTKDPIVPFNGTKGEAVFTPSVPTQQGIAKWVAVDGCQPKPVETQLAPPPLEVKRFDYSVAGHPTPDVVLITVDGGGHLWPGVKNPTVSSALLPKLGQTNNDVNATEIIVNFFKAH